MTVDFHIDELSPSRIAGWAWLPASPGDALVIELLDGDGELIGATIATEYRRDLTAAGKRGGWCAFAMLFPNEGGRRCHTLRARQDAHLFTLVDAVAFPPRR